MRAVRRFTVRAGLPEQLADLGTLATNLRWTWHPPTQDLFAAVDQDIWQRVGGDPLHLLAQVPAERLERLAADGGFLGQVRESSADLRRYMEEPRWYQRRGDELDGTRFPASIAYFSMEFGVTEALPNYSGGLGVLAGDHLKAASDLGVPLIGVGLLYRSGYFRQSLSLDGWQVEHYPIIDPSGLPLEPLAEPSGAPILVHVAMPGGRILRARIWKAQVGRVPLLLLDSDIEENSDDLRSVTDRLYGGDQDHRIRQEILAGIGGVRAVRTFCELTGTPQPEVFHTNEGHAGFLGLERLRELVSGNNLDVDQAMSVVRAGTVFTTHTPVPAGIDRFPVDLVQHYFGDESLLPGIDLRRILALGAESNAGMFNMAHMGLRLAQRANGVSKLHGAVSRSMFGALWPGFDTDEVPISSVTNGVHGPTWAAREMSTAFGEGHPSEEDGSPVADAMNDADLWQLRCGLRERLVGEVRRRVRAAWLQRGASALELNWTDSVFDPDVLTVGFARRVPTYKRLTLMLRDPERLRALLLHPERPVQLVVAGKSHPADDGGKALIQQIVRFADDAQVRHRIVFLPDYDMSMARYLYWGCDVWLNNPMRPLEACGTSGMKAALNGGLNLSIRDGWWDEFYDGSNGWAIPTADGVNDPVRRDDLEAAALYELLGSQVAPLFYDRDKGGVPSRWMSMVRHTLLSLGPQVQASRMVREYVEAHYAPAATAGVLAQSDGFRVAKDLAEYRRRLAGAWPHIRVTSCELALDDGHTPVIGDRVHVHASVDLAGLDPSDVEVQAVVGRVSDADELSDVVTAPMRPVATGRYSAEIALPHAGALGVTARVLPKHGLLATQAELGKVVLA
ncbi:Glycogen phosphorylase [Alloactinosynnema sp. L-07]|uniref:alpha-glucan family phosphorylase n=1 Tax=Alloactinosynnema sp. L-07 TaxID=1653480 RepID=UPI00065F08CD|nr:alpha-glucan family phosphorylase [Alloactinosynnema sp. L-07]CRK58955.1 Glycogen phosphorylase [Alloactinosynnema sp. L-07]